MELCNAKKQCAWVIYHKTSVTKGVPITTLLYSQVQHSNIGIFTNVFFFCNLQVYFEPTGTSKEENVSGRI
jgi:hypothetical protein